MSMYNVEETLRRNGAVTLWAKGESPSAGPSAQVKETQKMIGGSLVRRILVYSPLIGLQQIVTPWDSGTQIIPDRSSQP